MISTARIMLTLSLAMLLVVPALAQRGDRGRPDGPNEGPRRGGHTLQGWVSDVRQGVVTLALLTRVATPDAPGKVPAQYAQTAAALNAQAKELEARGEAEEAAKRRTSANNLLCWREIAYTLNPKDALPIIGVRVVSMQDVQPDMRLRIPVEVDGDVREGQVPALVRQIMLATQVGPNLPAIARIHSKNRDKTFMLLVGDVISIKPLMLDINGTKVQVETPPAYRLLRQTMLTQGDMQPGQRVMARVEMAAPQEIRSLKRLLITFDKEGVPLEPQDDLKQ